MFWTVFQNLILKNHIAICYDNVIFILPECNDVQKLPLYCLVCLCTLAQARELAWHDGVIVLRNEQIVTGEVALPGNYDLVLFRKGDTVSVYPAHKIKSVFFYDAKQNVNHRLVSAKEEHMTHPVYRLYEIVLQGELSVWRKQTSPVANSDKFDFDYFIRFDDHLLPLQQFRHKVYHELLKNAHEEILTFVTRENLDPSQPADALRIIEFYNHQVKESAVAANR